MIINLGLNITQIISKMSLYPERLILADFFQILPAKPACAEASAGRPKRKAYIISTIELF